MLPWQDISYLKSGTRSQQRAYSCLIDLGIFNDLRDFTPVLVSTVCLDIDTPSSDLDIICCAPDFISFRTRTTQLYGAFDRFQVKESRGGALVCGFWHLGLELELYAHPLPVTEQRAYLHLCQTARVLSHGGPLWRSAIRALKERGTKTEPAVAQCLGLRGDPYEEIERLSSLSDEQLAQVVAQRTPALEKICY